MKQIADLIVVVGGEVDCFYNSIFSEDEPNFHWIAASKKHKPKDNPLFDSRFDYIKDGKITEAKL